MSTLQEKLKGLAEQFRDSANAVELLHGKQQWAQTVNVIHAYESCAEEIEALLKSETPAACSTGAVCLLATAPPEQTANAS